MAMHPHLARLRLQAEVDAARGRLAQPTDTLNAIAGDGNGNVAIPNSHDIVCRDSASGTVLFATNPDLHTIQEGEALQLVPMNDRAPMLWRVPPVPAATLAGLFVAAFTDSTASGVSRGWRILRFVDLPAATYTDLGSPGAALASSPSFMGVADNALFAITPSFCVYHNGAWALITSLPVSLHSGSRLFMRHAAQMHTIYKSAAGTVSRVRLHADATATLIDSFSVGATEALEYATTPTPDDDGPISVQLRDTSTNVFRLATWDGATLTTIVTSPAYIGAGPGTNQPLDYYETVTEGGLPITYAAATNLSGEQEWHRSNGGVAFSLQCSLRFPVTTDDLVLSDYSGDGRHRSSGLAHFEPDGAGGVWAAGNAETSIFLFGGETIATAETHYGPDPTGETTYNRDEHTIVAHHTSGGVRTFIASYYTNTGAGNFAKFHSIIPIGSYAYVSLGLRNTSTWTAPTPLGLFRYPVNRIGALERFLPTDALSNLGGCGLMLAHDVTEAAAV